jgi:hypothetical protein
MLKHCAVCRVNAHGTQCEINRAIDVANGVRCSHLALNDCKDSDVKCTAVLLCPWLKWNLNSERPEIRVEKIVDLINPRAAANRIERAA